MQHQQLHSLSLNLASSRTSYAHKHHHRTLPEDVTATFPNSDTPHPHQIAGRIEQRAARRGRAAADGPPRTRRW